MGGNCRKEEETIRNNKQMSPSDTKGMQDYSRMGRKDERLGRETIETIQAFKYQLEYSEESWIHEVTCGHSVRNHPLKLRF